MNFRDNFSVFVCLLHFSYKSKCAKDLSQSSVYSTEKPRILLGIFISDFWLLKVWLWISASESYFIVGFSLSHVSSPTRLVWASSLDTSSLSLRHLDQGQPKHAWPPGPPVMIQAPRHLQLAGWQAEHLGGGFNWSQVIWVLERLRCGNRCSFQLLASVEQLNQQQAFEHLVSW